MARIFLTAPLSAPLWWGTGGSPSGDGSVANPFDCPATAWRYIQSNYDLGGVPGLVITLQMIPGTCVLPGVGNCVGPLVGQVSALSVKFLGDPVTPANCTIDGRNALTVALGGTDGAAFSFGGFRFYSKQANTAFDGSGTHAIMTDMCISSTTLDDYHYSATNMARLTILANRGVETGGPGSHLNAFGAGNITVQQQGLWVWIMGNSVVFGQGFASCVDNGQITDSNTIYYDGRSGNPSQPFGLGYPTGGPRTVINTGGQVATGSGTPLIHFPGNSSYPGSNQGNLITAPGTIS